MCALRRFLKRNHGTEGPSAFVFFDTETHNPGQARPGKHQLHKFRFGAAKYVLREGGKVKASETVIYDSIDVFWQWFATKQSKNRPLWAVAHNLGFDGTILELWRLMEARVYDIGPRPRPDNPRTGKPRKPWCGVDCFESRPCFGITKGPGGIVKWCDTGNYWPVSLGTLAKSVGMEKLPFPGWEADEETWFRYCLNDVAITERAFLSLLDRWVKEDCGVFKMTGPGLAWTNWKHTAPAIVGHEDKAPIMTEPESIARPLEREAYYGGRIEPFYLGEFPEPVYYVDCNSLYPFVMREKLYPWRRLEKVLAPTVKELTAQVKTFGAVARVRLRSKHNTYPIRHDGCQLHCNGRFTTSLCGPELRRALESGDVEHVYEAHLYLLRDLFREWVDRWYEVKLQAQRTGGRDSADYHFAKLMLNSLSGRFGMRGDKWTTRPELGRDNSWSVWCDIDPKTKREAQWRSRMGSIQVKELGREPDEAWPIVSAFITSWGREYMRDLIQRLGEESVLYIATDGVIVTESALERMRAWGLLDDERLGAFRVTHGPAPVSIHGPNWYQHGEKVCRAGVWGRATFSKEHGWTAEIWEQLSGILSQRPDGTVKVHTVPLKKQSATRKGKRTPSGWVRPFRLSPDPDWTDKPQVNHREIPH